MEKEPYSTLEWLDTALRKGYTEEVSGYFENKFVKIRPPVEDWATEYHISIEEAEESEALIVESIHADILSWVFVELQNAFKQYLPEEDKKAFFQQLGEAARFSHTEGRWTAHSVVRKAGELTWKRDLKRDIEKIRSRSPEGES